MESSGPPILESERNDTATVGSTVNDCLDDDDSWVAAVLEQIPELAIASTNFRDRLDNPDQD
jgi:hypothetical protein